MEKEILTTFLHNEKLRFNEIEKLVKERSNKIAYHLNKLVEKGLIEKKGEYYKLQGNFEHLIPYISNKKSILPVILVAVEKSGKVFLIKRKKRPFKELLSLPGGRILLKESIKTAAERIMEEKTNIKCKFKKINSISLEHVQKQKEIVHSFLLIFVTAETSQEVYYTDIKKNKSKIISSDYYLIKNNLDKKINVKELKTRF